jgi:outer membrane protein TolC
VNSPQSEFVVRLNLLPAVSVIWLIVMTIQSAPLAARDEAPGRVRIREAEPAPRPRQAIPRPASGPSPAAPPTTQKVVKAQYTDDESRPELADESPAAAPQLPAAGAESPLDPLKFLLDENVTPIDLRSALQLAGVQNPEILLAENRVVEAVALRQLAAAQFLPTINLGGSSDAHWGNLQQSNGNILSVRREDVFVGAGANAIAAGTVNIPGIMWNLNISDTIYNTLTSCQEVDRTGFASQATRQDTLLNVALAYINLVRAEGTRSVAIVTRSDARELARITAAYLATGAGRKADADRASTEQTRREAEVLRAEGGVVSASAGLCRLLHLDPSLRLHAIDNQVLPRSIVPDPIPLPELLAIALMHRPELNERRVGVAKSLLSLKGAQTLPFSPTVLIGFSAGGFGGGSNLVAQPVTSLPFGRGEPRFGNFDDREDLDAMAYWTLQNLGVGNKSQIEAARSRVSSADFELLVTLDRIRSEVAAAHARTHARFAQIRSCELAVQTSLGGFTEDMNRIQGQEGLPLEAVDSLRLLGRSRLEYLNAILDYNQAQFQLYVALGKPPAELLMRPVEPDAENRPHPIPEP